MSNNRKHTYNQILKSTALTGGSQVISIVANIVRMKFFAIFLGPSGVGLMGLYAAITNMANILTGLGIRSSGVRQIAEATVSKDREKTARVVLTVRRAAMVLGICGTLLMIALSKPLSWITFATPDYYIALSLLAITILFSSISGGQAALIQGVRRVSDLARLTAFGAILSTALGVPIIYFWREKGIVPFFITISLVTVLTSWWYARKIPIGKIILSWKETLAEASGLLSLGMVFMATSLMASGVVYFVRIILARKFGMEGIGFYQASNALSNVYIGFILSAMGMDFYPRLTAVANDNPTCNRLVNEQTEIGLLIAAPGVLITITLTPLVIELFYSARFIPAYDILRWQILGVFLRVVSWPMGFILLAKGKGKIYFWTECMTNLLHIVLFYTGISFFGLKGAGMAFMALYAVYTVMIFFIVSSVSQFCWSAANIKLCITIGLMIMAVFSFEYVFSSFWCVIIGTFVSALMGIYSFKTLYALAGADKVSELWKKIRVTFG